MCGIAGFFAFNNSKFIEFENNALINRMTNLLKHRGPDKTNYYTRNPISFGHTRLSILDLSDNGSQPMVLENNIVITYNGECYNFLDLKKELESKGIKFKSFSDTEVLLQVYNYWGLEGLKKCEGIFAFSIWDPNKNLFVLMRDRLGVKPLFFNIDNDKLLFASEIKSLLEDKNIKVETNNQSFSEYLWYGNSFENRTFYNNIFSLEPGNWLIIDNGSIKIESWWKIEELKSEDYSDYDKTKNLVLETLDISVARQLVSDVPMGIFLSGGIDSSAIAASISINAQKKIESFSAGFDFDKGINELPKARIVADLLKLNHHELKINSKFLQSIIEDLAISHDEPFADAANIPLYLMSKSINDKIKVVFQGDGGDELFGGYRRYLILRNLKYWQSLPNINNRLLDKFKFKKRFSRIINCANEKDNALRMAMLLTTEVSTNPPEDLLNIDYAEYLHNTTDPFLVYKNASERFKIYTPVEQMLLTDLTVQLPSQFLTKVDRATMAAGVEARVPILDEKMLKLAINIPSKWKVNYNQKKIILRDSQRNRLPKSILDGPKTGFSVPYQYWLKTTLYEYTAQRILDNSFLNKFNFNKKKVENLLFDHKNSICDNGFMLWKILQLSFQK